ncbi:MAG: hypothetical protein LBQ32_12350 [Burkholderiaceae bacterium]|jgi:hypothetical protein|nr:hypothetical protein [Burkholderiaceae bacterium]
MDIDIRSFDGVHLWSDSATRSPAPRSPRHAALFVLAGISRLRPLALPGTPSAVLASASNCRFQDDQFRRANLVRLTTA